MIGTPVVSSVSFFSMAMSADVVGIASVIFGMPIAEMKAMAASTAFCAACGSSQPAGVDAKGPRHPGQLVRGDRQDLAKPRAQGDPAGQSMRRVELGTEGLRVGMELQATHLERRARHRRRERHVGSRRLVVAVLDGRREVLHDQLGRLQRQRVGERVLPYLREALDGVRKRVDPGDHGDLRRHGQHEPRVHQGNLGQQARMRDGKLVAGALAREHAHGRHLGPRAGGGRNGDDGHAPRHSLAAEPLVRRRVVFSDDRQHAHAFRRVHGAPAAESDEAIAVLGAVTLHPLGKGGIQRLGRDPVPHRGLHTGLGQFGPNLLHAVALRHDLVGHDERALEAKTLGVRTDGIQYPQTEHDFRGDAERELQTCTGRRHRRVSSSASVRVESRVPSAAHAASEDPVIKAEA